MKPFDVPSPPRVEFTPKGDLDRAGERLEINTAPSVAQVEFEYAISISAGDTPAPYLAHVLSQPGVEDAISSLLSLGYYAVTIEGLASGAAARASRRHVLDDVEQLLEHAAILATIADALPPCEPRAPQREESLESRLVSGALTLFILSLFVGPLTCDRWPIYNDEWITPWAIAAVLWFIAIAIFTPFIRGDSRSLNSLISFIVLLAISIPCTVTPALRALNALADTSTPRVVQANVVDAYRSYGKRSKTTYHVKLDFHDGQTPQEHIISEGDFISVEGHIEDHGAVDILISDGALGWPRIISIGP